MTEKQKSNYRPIIFTLILVVAAALAVIYFTGSDAQKTVPVIRVSYFKDNSDFATVIDEHLHAEFKRKKYFWIGYEPEKENQMDLLVKIKEKIEKHNGAFDVVILDKELMLPADKENIFGLTHEIPLKEGFAEAAELIKANKDKNILVITAAIYSTNLIETNPQAKIKDLTKEQPLIISMGFFPALAEEERYNLFRCDTEDKTGTSPWGCTVINKSRAIRRRIDLQKLAVDPMPRIGLMDLSGEADYMVLVGK